MLSVVTLSVVMLIVVMLSVAMVVGGAKLRGQGTLPEGKGFYNCPPHQGSLFCKKEITFATTKVTDLKWLVQGGELY